MSIKGLIALAHMTLYTAGGRLQITNCQIEIAGAGTPDWVQINTTAFQSSTITPYFNHSHNVVVQGNVFSMGAGAGTSCPKPRHSLIVRMIVRRCSAPAGRDTSFEKPASR